MANLKLKPREITGKKVKDMRAQGVVPVALYGPKFESENFSIDAKKFRQQFKKVGYSKLFDVDVEGGDTEKVVVKEVQAHPVTDQILHVSLYVIDKNSEITADIPIELTGIAPAEEQGVGIIVNTLDTITVRCLPDLLPAQFEVNMDGLKDIGDNVTVEDVAATFAEGVELDSKMDPTASIVGVVSAQKEIVEEEPEELAEGEEGAELPEGEAAEGETTEGEAETEPAEAAAE